MRGGIDEKRSDRLYRTQVSVHQRATCIVESADDQVTLRFRLRPRQWTRGQG